MARTARPGRRTTRSARRCRSSIICRTARRTIAISTASTFPLDALAAAGATVEDLGKAASTPALRQCLHGLAARTGKLLDQSAPFSASIRDVRLALEVAVIQALARRLVAMLRTRDPLSERVHLTKSGVAPSGSWDCSAARSAGSGVSSRRPKHPATREVARGRHHTAKLDSTKLVTAELLKPSSSQRASGSSFYTAMRILPQAQRDAMYEIYSFCRRVDDIADFERPAAAAAGAAQRVARARSNALYQGKVGPLVTGLAQPVRDFDLAARGFPDRHRRHGDGHARRHPRADSCHARSLLRPRRERGRTAVGARVRHGARSRHSCSPIISAARCSSPTSCATSTRTPTSAASICRARRCTEAGISTTDPATALRSPRSRTVCDRLVERARKHFARSRHDHGALATPGREGAAHHGRGLSPILDGMVARGWQPPRQRVRVSRARLALILLRYAII